MKESNQAPERQAQGASDMTADAERRAQGGSDMSETSYKEINAKPGACAREAGFQREAEGRHPYKNRGARARTRRRSRSAARRAGAI